MSDPIALRIADAPAKDDVFELLERTRLETEQGEVLAVVVIPIHPNKEWSVRSAGDIGMLELGGLLGRAWMDAMEALGKGGVRV
jgi:hypothetical protein